MEFLLALNSNKLFWGVAMVLMNMGSRYVLSDLTKVHESILMNNVFKKFVLFCMFFIGSRDVLVALMLTFLFSTVLQGLLDEKSKYNLIPDAMLKYVEGSRGKIQEAEYKRAKEIVQVYEEGVQFNPSLTEKDSDMLSKYKELYKNS